MTSQARRSGESSQRLAMIGVVGGAVARTRGGILTDVGALQAPELTDGVIRLRPLRRSDGDAVVAALQDPEIPRWTAIPSPYTDREFQVWFGAQAASREAGQGVHLVITDLDDRLLGAVGAQNLMTDSGDIGYWVAREARRRGVAARGVRLLRDWLHTHARRPYLEILVHPDNVPSQRVAEAAGFAATGEYRRNPRPGLPGDYMVFGWPDDAAAGSGAG
jgi:RimJ/RimL family protein N-acetyltransferase